MPIFIKEQATSKKLQIGVENKKLEEEQKKLEELKEITSKQTDEFFNKQRQIATFLDCKKSFLGKIKYYFSNRKKIMGSVESHKLRSKAVEDEKQEPSDKKQVIEEIKQEEKESYTIEDLIEICTKLEARKKVVKNLTMDRKAQELKKINLERKIKNANIYLNEIELHKKSIFEFWKFANKDELPSLNEGEEQELNVKEKIGKSFVYEEDIEDLGKKMDELQRRKLSKNETDAIFAVKHALNSCQILSRTKSDKLTKEELKILQKELDTLKQEYKGNKEIIQVKDFDIFGGISEDKTKMRMLHNEKHRENEKDKYKVLGITKDTELETYIDNLRNYLNLVKEAFRKITTPFELPIYIASEQKIRGDDLKVANLNATEELYKEAKKIEGEEGIYFYIIELPKNAPLLYYTNITEYDNLNQTLPTGMDVTTKVLANLQNYQLEKKEEKDFHINYIIDEYTNKIVTVHAKKYIAK